MNIPFNGTTLVAAARLGRNAIGIELDESYYKIAVDRVKKEDMQKIIDANEKLVEERS